jgi:hypothetical protein
MLPYKQPCFWRNTATPTFVGVRGQKRPRLAVTELLSCRFPSPLPRSRTGSGASAPACAPPSIPAKWPPTWSACAATSVGLRGDIGTFLDRYGIDITDEVWATLISAMERIDGTIAHLRRAGIRFA